MTSSPQFRHFHMAHSQVCTTIIAPANPARTKRNDSYRYCQSETCTDTLETSAEGNLRLIERQESRVPKGSKSQERNTQASFRQTRTEARALAPSNPDRHSDGSKKSPDLNEIGAFLQAVRIRSTFELLLLCVSEDTHGYWSGRWDSNSRPSAPKADALPGCATPRRVATIPDPGRAAYVHPAAKDRSPCGNVQKLPAAGTKRALKQ